MLFFGFYSSRESVLEHFVEKVQCRGMFSTHYHRVAIDYNKDPRVCFYTCLPVTFFLFKQLWPPKKAREIWKCIMTANRCCFIQVSLCHMGCQVGKGVGDVEEVTFLYRLSAGICPKSYGVNVARLAGKILCFLLCCRNALQKIKNLGICRAIWLELYVIENGKLEINLNFQSVAKPRLNQPSFFFLFSFYFYFFFFSLFEYSSFTKLLNICSSYM